LPILQTTENAKQVIQQVADLRQPEDTVVLLGGSPDQMTAQLVDSRLVNPLVDTFIGYATDEIKVFASGNCPPFPQAARIVLETERAKPNFCSDSISLEAQLGFRFTCMVTPLVPAAPNADLLNV
jgi:hypothetical protein